MHNPRIRRRGPRAAVASCSRNDDEDYDKGMLASIAEFIGDEIHAPETPKESATAAPDRPRLPTDALEKLRSEYTFLSALRQNCPDNALVDEESTVTHLRPMSHDELLRYSTKLTALFVSFVSMEAPPQTPADGGCDSATPPYCPSPGISMSASIRSLRLPPVIQTTTISVSEDFEGNEMINDYSIITELGRGSYGSVALAVNNTTNEAFAIKIMKKNLLKKGSGDSVVKREIAVMRKLRHQNIVPLIEVLDDEESDKMYMVMKYIDNGPMLQVRDDLTCTTLSPETATKYLRQLISGLQYLHLHGVIHRDLKPDNVMVDKQGVVYLTDFGVSDIIENPYGSIQGTEGTPVFLAPELLADNKNRFKGAPVDIWALGVTFYMALFGKVPFMGHTWSEVATKIKEQPPEFPSDAPSDWVDVLTKLLEKDPKKRITLKALKRHSIFASLAGSTHETFDDSAESVSASTERPPPMAVTEEEVLNSTRRLVRAPIVKSSSLSDATQERVAQIMEDIRTRVSEREVKQIGQLVEEEEGEGNSDTESDTPKRRTARPPAEPPLFNPRQPAKATTTATPKGPPPVTPAALPTDVSTQPAAAEGKLRQVISMKHGKRNENIAPVMQSLNNTMSNSALQSGRRPVATPKLPQIVSARSSQAVSSRRK